MIDENTLPTQKDGIVATPCYAPLIIGVGAGVEAIEASMMVAKERGINVVVVGEPSQGILEQLPQEIFLKEIEHDFKSLKEYEYSDYKDGKASRRERRAKERKAKRFRSNGA